jgi:hypothetical protein
VVQYRFAHSSEKRIVDASVLATQEFPKKSEFFCLVCERSLIAKVRGGKKQPHFAHHPGADCHPETYLHRLAKLVFFEVYNQCRDESEPFFIELTHPTICRQYSDLFGACCDLKKPKAISHNLLSYYDEIKLEPRRDGFIPDLLLFKSSRPDECVFVEIAVTHPSEDAKLGSSNKIIEIPITSESDVEKIRTRRLTESDAQFINFARPSAPVVDAECRCHDLQTHAFVLYESGKCRLSKGALCEIRKDISVREGKTRFVRLFDTRGATAFGFRPTEASIFRRGIEEARAAGHPIKNCFTCRHRRKSDSTSAEQKIYCEKLDSAFNNSNQAVECPDFEHNPLAFAIAEKTYRRPIWPYL